MQQSLDHRTTETVSGIYAPPTVSMSAPPIAPRPVPPDTAPMSAVVAQVEGMAQMLGMQLAALVFYDPATGGVGLISNVPVKNESTPDMQSLAFVLGEGEKRVHITMQAQVAEDADDLADDEGGQP